VERISSYRRTGREWKQVKLRQSLDYNKPIDPMVLRPEMPGDVMVVDQINRKPGLVKGDLTEEQITKKVVREFLEAMIAEDYDKAGAIFQAIPGKNLKERSGPIRFVRIIEIGKPVPAPNPCMQALRVPAKVEIEIQGRREVKDFSPLVRPAFGQPDWRVIDGGI
jgi:hypothetical protein